jgi:hypothetical protein
VDNDVRDRRGMYEARRSKETTVPTEFPQHRKRQEMLRYIHEWVARQHAQGNYSPMLASYEVELWAREREDISGPEALSLFQILVEEGYVALSYPLRGRDRVPWTIAALRGLTDRGLLYIGELPADPDARLLGSLAALEQAIRALDAPDEQKHAAMEATKELRDFVRALPLEQAARLARLVIAGMTRG